MSSAGHPDPRLDRTGGAPAGPRPDPRLERPSGVAAGRLDPRTDRVPGTPTAGRPDPRLDLTAGAASAGRPDLRADRTAGAPAAGRPDPRADRFDPRVDRTAGGFESGRAVASDREGSADRPADRPAAPHRAQRERPVAAPTSRSTAPTATSRAERDLRAESADDVAAMLAAAAGVDAGAPAGLEFRSIDAAPTSTRTFAPRRGTTGNDRAMRRASSTAAFAGAASSASKPTSKRTLRRAVTTRVVSTVAMGFVAMLAIATSVPSLSLLTPEDVQAMALSNNTVTTIDGQRVEIASGALAAAVDKGGYEHQTIEEYARAAGIRPEATFTNNPLGTIQWPFAVGVHIGDRFGYRDCAGCSSDHHGQDFNPGLGAQIQAIADGVVSNSTDAGGSLGVVTMIDHVIDGEVVTSVYAHMEYGSRRMEVGDTVKVGDIVGTTGNTGMSTGPHLHFEIRIGGIDGVWVDPLEWLYANTN
ncbi:murein DD-endopeptidase MepM/ murein hydrolase activator NlpD [Agromyces flavus]|nr:M23 family metallopeptidase [Agromyces flavus]MCP2366477.1 murein DD-endopeptidase MepM/ murein hydrolase activator NlpD [Agromyces flavus]